MKEERQSENCVSIKSFQKRDAFDLILDEKIDFIQALQMPGTEEKVSSLILEFVSIYDTIPLIM